MCLSSTHLHSLLITMLFFAAHQGAQWIALVSMSRLNSNIELTLNSRRAVGSSENLGGHVMCPPGSDSPARLYFCLLLQLYHSTGAEKG